ncbi:hypothetical protein QI429_10030, partial [Staphylococcus aureus]|nr:hypothetical protein [Staphylococcus aureus]
KGLLYGLFTFTQLYGLYHGNTKLKLNGYFIASIISPLNLNKLNNLYVEEEFYHTYNELIVKYTEVKE